MVVMSDPKTVSLMTRLQKKGVQVNLPKEGAPHFWAEINGNIIDWFDQGGFAICLRVRRVHDKDDSQSDYCAGSFAHSIKQAMEWAGIA